MDLIRISFYRSQFSTSVKEEFCAELAEKRMLLLKSTESALSPSIDWISRDESRWFSLFFIGQIVHETCSQLIFRCFYDRTGGRKRDS